LTTMRDSRIVIRDTKPSIHQAADRVAQRTTGRTVMEFSEANRSLDPGYLSFESGYKPLSDGKQLVAALTRMPGCRAKMVDWWFSWLGGTEQYKMWHPSDHIFSDWEKPHGWQVHRRLASRA
jgi:hypothetical protein